MIRESTTYYNHDFCLSVKGWCPLRKISIGSDWTIFQFVLSPTAGLKKVENTSTLYHPGSRSQIQTGTENWYPTPMRGFNTYFPKWKPTLRYSLLSLENITQQCTFPEGSGVDFECYQPTALWNHRVLLFQCNNLLSLASSVLHSSHPRFLYRLHHQQTRSLGCFVFDDAYMKRHFNLMNHI